MERAEYYHGINLPKDYFQQLIPGTGIFVPIPPEWTHKRDVYDTKRSKSMGAIVMPCSEIAKSEILTYLSINALPNYYDPTEHDEAEEFLKNTFAGKTDEVSPIHAVDIPVTKKHPFLSVSGNMPQIEKLDLDDPDAIILKSLQLYKQDTLNIETGTYYSCVFFAPLKDMDQYLPVVSMMLNKTAFDPKF